MSLSTPDDVLLALSRRYPEMVVEPPYPVYIKGASRDHLPEFFRDLGFTKGAEIGVFKGVYSEQLCQGNPNLRLLCVDPYLKYPDFRDQIDQKMFDDAQKEAQKRLAPYDCTFIRRMSTHAAQDIRDGSLDFIYIDGNHQFEFVVADLAAWIPKVRVGGIIAGHDYKSIPNHPALTVVEAIDGWTRAYAVAPWFVLGRTKAKASEHRDKYRSWMWVQR